MTWECLGKKRTENEVAILLNSRNIGPSVTVSLRADRTAFVVWADTSVSPDPNKTWKPLAHDGSQHKIATAMNKNNLAPNSAIVSLDSNDVWQLWGYVLKTVE